MANDKVGTEEEEDEVSSFVEVVVVVLDVVGVVTTNSAGWLGKMATDPKFGNNGGGVTIGLKVDAMLTGCCEKNLLV